MSDNISRELLKHFEESTARAREAEQQEARRVLVRRLLIVFVLVAIFVAGAIITCGVKL
jgi:hypothetical protein